MKKKGVKPVMKFIENNLWVEKYRPTSLKDYVWSSDAQKKQIEKILKEGEIPHLLLIGDPGTGKTTLAKVLFKELRVESQDILEINGSVDNSIDIIRNNITTFASTLSLSGMRYILFDEADYLSKNAQAGLRNLMENFSSNCRFILTCNYGNKVIPALKSRCQTFIIKTPDKDQIIKRVENILKNENIEFEEDILLEYIDKFFPDLRKIINSLQQNSFDGKLNKLNHDNIDIPDWYKNVIEYFIQNKIYEARKIIINNLDKEDYEDFYKFIYDIFVNEIFLDNIEAQMDSILVIQKHLVDHSLCADPEINLSACLVRLQNIVNNYNIENSLYLKNHEENEKTTNSSMEQENSKKIITEKIEKPEKNVDNSKIRKMLKNKLKIGE